MGQGGRMTVQALQQKVGRAVERGLESLEKKGFIEGCQILRGKQASSAIQQGLLCLSLPESSPPLEEWISLLPKAEARIVAHLDREGPCSAKALRKVLPRSGKALKDLTEKGFIEYRTEEALPETPVPESLSFRFLPQASTPEQEAAVNAIRPLLDENAFHSFLLHGVTSSGKTEVYLRVIQQALEAGRDSLVLVPEIALTPQTRPSGSPHGSARRLPCPLGPYRTGTPRFLVEDPEGTGTHRNGLPVPPSLRPSRNLGVIVVDEEHDPSYKQQDRVRYHARDLALVRGQREKAVVILGSATPSLSPTTTCRGGKALSWR